MHFQPTPLDGAWVVDIEPHADERGFFARAWCEREFAAHRLETHLTQCDISYNRRAGTLRGLHFQSAPHAQAKVVRCTRGAIFDAIVDIRPGSRTFGRHFTCVLSAENRTMLFVPQGFAHGFETLEDDTEVFYQMSAPFVPRSGHGVRWDDPRLGIPWPIPAPIMNERDRVFPTLHDLPAAVLGPDAAAMRLAGPAR